MTSWQYIAGFFDGEGWISKYAKPEHYFAKYVIGVGQSTQQANVIFEIERFLKINGINCRVYREGRKAKTDMTRLVMSDSKSIFLFLSGVSPYLLVKHEKAAAALQASKMCMERIADRKRRVARAVQMYKSGIPVRQILKETNIRKEAVYRWNKKLEATLERN